MDTSDSDHSSDCQIEQFNDKSRCVICLDWDDTTFPTTYLMSNIEFIINDSTNKIEQFQIKSNAKEVIKNLEKAGVAILELLNKLFLYFEPSNIKLITNSANGWVLQSLSIAATVCKIYNKIKNILIKNQTEVMYARNYSPGNLNAIYWKTKCFDLVLSQFNLHSCKPLNIITIGDQWSDHNSIEQSWRFCMYKENIFHHKIKFMEAPNCKYLSMELIYIKNIIESYILCNLNNDDIMLEFEN
eukprot:771967_1